MCILESSNFFQATLLESSVCEIEYSIPINLDFCWYMYTLPFEPSGSASPGTIVGVDEQWKHKSWKQIDPNM